MKEDKFILSIPHPKDKNLKILILRLKTTFLKKL